MCSSCGTTAIGTMASATLPRLPYLEALAKNAGSVAASAVAGASVAFAVLGVSIVRRP